MSKKFELQLDLGEGYHDPKEFVDATVFAEEVGFHTAWLGDHFVPWVVSHKRSAFVWSLFGVCLERTANLKIGPLVCSPIGARYHPALIAQASATLDNMYPGRFLLGVGTGEALNEVPYWHGAWPKWEERVSRLAEGVRLIRRLWQSEKPFNFKGKYFGYEEYQLYTRPRKRIPIYFSAIGRKSAFTAGSVGADGLITLSPRNDPESIGQKLIPSFIQGAKEANSIKRQEKTKLLVSLAFTFETPKSLLESSHLEAWTVKNSWSLDSPTGAERYARRKVSLADLERNYHFCRNWDDVIKIIEKYKSAGATAVILPGGADKQTIKKLAENLLSVF